MNNTRVAPRKIINRIYENQVNEVSIEDVRQINSVCKIRVSPRVSGCLRKINVIDVVAVIVRSVGIRVISEDSLIKILVLGINDRRALFSDTLRDSQVWFTRPIFFLNY